MITALYHKAAANCRSLGCVEEKMSACLSSGELCNVNALCFKVMRTPVSPNKIEPVKTLCFICVVKCEI